MGKRWCTFSTIRRELDWSRERLIYELQNGLRFRTVPPGHEHKIDWHDPYLRPYINFKTSEISIPSGVVVGAINDAVAVITGRPRPPKRRSELEGMTIGIEVLLPDAEVPAPPASAPAASPASARKVSEADLRAAVLAIVADHTKQRPDGPALDEVALHEAVENHLGMPVARDRVMNARDECAPQFRRRVGRPRKDEQ